MNNIDELVSSIKSELANEECVQNYFYYKKLVESDSTLSKLDEEMRLHQKQMCRNKEDNDLYFKEKTIYEELRKKIDENPILINYQIAKDEVFSLLVDIKNLLS